MKTQLTKEQSEHLLALGVPKRYATILPSSYVDEIPEVIITLTDLLEILPHTIDKGASIKYLVIKGYSNEHCVSYYFGIDNTISVSFRCKELIDALYELLIWTIEEGYLKF